MRLFSALVPPDPVVESLRTALADAPSDARLRRLPPGQWHITLGFFGEDDPEARAAWLRPRLAGRPMLDLRLAGAGTFPGVLWVGVRSAGLDALAGASGADELDRPFHPHLTVARGHDPGARRRLLSRLRDYRGPWWTATEVVLFASERGGDGMRYTPIERFGLGAGLG
ncbi:RNA 2',3'-cyclic phosphodiesterase [Amycolatopsis cihanbeyliensis]|uniref:RNA 2',3'-cyclic phosphodiesterase n=1 Tax=Amycolatopsis cihanbeyliensis TaxID=1128664 RepID=A0A542CT94_AMYCI|nr:RNA 2',3'-cyclic phosphodiesterase [Amycolatopsis cihanbeyliensis]TQI94039.1 2'-5' RNA ligase [Amycolatopsis cihanbeyliensis]